MALYREHTGILDNSLQTTIVVKKKSELLVKLIEKELKWHPNIEAHSVDMQINPYPSLENNFDKRIGWYTHIVLLSIDGQDHRPVGFLSESLDN